MQQPDDVTGWNLTETEAGNPKYVSLDRRAKVIIKEVKTHGGEVFQARLYESTDPHGRGRPVTSTIAESAGEIPAAVRELDRHRRQ